MNRTAVDVRMAVDPARFLPTILSVPEFRDRGILFGTERFGGFRVHWVVIDPRHHLMFVWQKDADSYPAAARNLGSSVFTSGPFSNHAGGSPVKSTVKVGIDVLRASISPRTLRAAARESLVRRYQARVPLGHVVGSHAGIHETSVDRPRVHTFGRRDGSTFDDYAIVKGNPEGFTEAIGGLFRPVTDYTPYAGNRQIRTGFWGLAPLTGNPVVHGPAVEDALRQGCGGVIVFVGGRANTGRLAALLAAIGVKDAVQVDGGDSLMLGHDRTMLIGRFMPEWKRLLQRWGVQFRPAAEPPTGP